MPTLLRLRPEGPQWPYSVAQLRADNPNVSFPASPSGDDLAPFNTFWVADAEQPGHDPRSEQVEEVEPALYEHGWRQQWRTRAATLEEVAAYDELNRPTPNWDRFKRIAMASDALNQILMDAYQTAPVAAGALAPALMRAETDNELADFVTAWALIVQAANVSPQVLAGFVGVATACHLPADFIAALQPSPN